MCHAQLLCCGINAGTPCTHATCQILGCTLNKDVPVITVAHSLAQRFQDRSLAKRLTTAQVYDYEQWVRATGSLHCHSAWLRPARAG